MTIFEGTTSTRPSCPVSTAINDRQEDNNNQNSATTSASESPSSCHQVPSSTTTKGTAADMTGTPAPETVVAQPTSSSDPPPVTEVIPSKETDLDTLDSSGGEGSSDDVRTDDDTPPTMTIITSSNNNNKPLKGLLKKSFSKDTKSKKKVKFSETMMVFCDDWPVEVMPQIIALKSPSDFSLLEVAASGYMFEPPMEYRDCLPFDPPPDYRDIVNGGSTGSSSGEGSSDDSLTDHLVHNQHNVYWESVILNDKEVLEEDAIIGVLKEDAILQAIGSHVEHGHVFKTDDDVGQDDFPIHYPPNNGTQSNLSPSSSNSSLVMEGAHQPPPSVSPAEDISEVQDLASDSSFTSQDTIIVMTKELMKGHLDLKDDDDHSLRDDVSITDSQEGQEVSASKEEEPRPSSTESDIGRFHVVTQSIEMEESLATSSVDGQSSEIDVNSIKVESTSGRFHVVSSQSTTSNAETGHSVSLSLPAKASGPPKKTPPPPPAKPPSIQRLRVKALEVTPEGVIVDPSTGAPQPQIPPLPLRSGSVPNSVMSVSEIRKSFEKRGSSLDSSSSQESPLINASNEAKDATNDLPKESKRDWTAAGQVDAAKAEVTPIPPTKPTKQPPPPPVKPRLPPRSLPIQSLSSSMSSTPSSSETSSITSDVPSAPSIDPPNVPNESTSAPQPTSADEVLVEYTQEPRAIQPTKRVAQIAHPYVQPRLQSQPVYLSLNRRNPGLTIFGQQASPDAGQGVIQPPPRTSASVGAGCPTKQAALIKTQQMMMQMSGQGSPQSGTTQTMDRRLHPRHPHHHHQHPIQLVTAGQPPQAIYGYIRTCPQTGTNVLVRPTCPVAAAGGHCPASGASPGPHGHYHHPQLLLRPMDQRLGLSQEFPNPSEIRRRDGLYAYPNVYNEPPQSGGKMPPVPPPGGHGGDSDELEQFAQQEKTRTDRIKQRYGVDDSDDPTFGFSHRPAVRGIRDAPPTSAANATFIQQQQQNHLYLHRLKMLHLQQVLAQQKGQAIPQGQSSPGGGQGPPLPARNVYVVQGPLPQQVMAGGTLPRNMNSQLSVATGQGPNRHSVNLSPNISGQQPQPDRPASSLGQASEASSNSPAGSTTSGSGGHPCMQCMMQQRHLIQLQQQHQQQQPSPQGTSGRPPSLHDPNLAQMAANNSLLTYKTISMPNVAMIRPIGPVPIHGQPGQLSVAHPPPASSPKVEQMVVSTTDQPPIPQPRPSMSASAALSAIADGHHPHHQAVHPAIAHVQAGGHLHPHHHPDLVKDATSRTHGGQPSPSGTSTASSSGGAPSISSSVSNSSPYPGSSRSSGSSTKDHHHTLSSLTASAAGLLKKRSKDKKSKSGGSSGSSDKKGNPGGTTKEGVIYYSMNV